MTVQHPTFVEQRRNICAQCPEKNPVGICNQCGCVILLKTILRSSECPMGHWGKESK